MKRSIISQFNQLQEKYIGLVATLNYRYLNLCIKAEEASLLPVKVHVNSGEVLNLEHCATMVKDNDYEFMIIPNFEDDLPQIAEGIAMVHPEFKQSVEKMTLEATEEYQSAEQVPYILLTMPEVDDERHDFMLETVDAMYDDCKLRMETAYAEHSAAITRELGDQSEETANQVKQALEKLNEEKSAQRDEMHENKLKEIEEAYQKWLGDYAKQEIAKMEEEAARGEDAGMSMKILDGLN